MHTVPFLMFLEEQKKLENPGTNNTPTNKEYSYIKRKKKKKKIQAHFMHVMPIEQHIDTL